MNGELSMSRWWYKLVDLRLVEGSCNFSTFILTRMADTAEQAMEKIEERVRELRNRGEKLIIISPFENPIGPYRSKRMARHLAMIALRETVLKIEN